MPTPTCKSDVAALCDGFLTGDPRKSQYDCRPIYKNGILNDHLAGAINERRVEIGV